MKKMRIDLYTHFFKVSHVHPSAYYALRRAFQELLQVQFVKIRGKVQKQNKNIFAAKSDEGEYRFHINYLPRFKEMLRDGLINDDEINYFKHEYPEPAEIDVKVPEKFQMRDYQEEAISYILDEGRSKLIAFSMGLGKTLTAVKAGELLGYRTIIIVLGRYKEKWRDDILELYGPDTNFILVKGLAQLLSIIEQAKEGNSVPDVIIVTTTTMQLYIKEWEKHQGKEIEGMVPPEEMYEILKIGYRIIDEAHQHFHMVFKNDLYSNLYKAVYLTATLESNDKFIQAMYNLIWPRAMRGQAVKPAPYDKTTALLYQHLNPDRVRWKSNQGYSHVMYEQSIWKHIPSRVEYLDMIGDVVEQKFLPLYEPGKKMLIFCSLVDTCKEVADYLNQRFKDKKWQISKFTAEDNKEIIDTNDITVSTLGKAGTALDISGLIVCFNTVALAEPKANLQAKGRLRDLSKKPGFEHIVPEYIYTVATDIPRHVQYHQEKKMLFAGRTTRITEERAQYTIGQSLGEYFRLNLKSHWDHIKMENLKLHDKTK
jgi:putative ATP-dependent DNA helicase|nr:MAG TPA: Cas system-associated protein [Caudoviricetes sp.]